mmetsp:Transcript_4343/g.6252  ORF Transcript_4343/g.6252 Transcript_4343/m.6252 type:complete len:415 (+) Transcript_4343:137-1381(+)
MRVRLCLSTAAYGQALMVGFFCFALFGYIRQQTHFVSTVHYLSDKSTILNFDRKNIEQVIKLSSSASKDYYTESQLRNSLRSCVLRQHQTLTFPKAPHFIIIGAQKSGSSALSEYLSQHPNLVGSNSDREKELHFLDWEIPFEKERAKKQKEMNVTEDGLWCFYGEKYANLFDTDLLRKNSSILAFEKTPSYMFHGYYLPEILKNVCPWKPKLLAILRNPIERAWSQYNMDISVNKKLRESSSFESVLEKEIEILRNLGLSNAPLLSDEDWNTPYFDIPNLTEEETIAAHKKHFRQVFLGNYLQRGMYAFQLRRWRDAFGANLLVVRFEDLYGGHAQACYNRILDHIGVARVNIPKPDSNHWSRGRYRQKLSKRTHDYLQKFFQPYNDQLVKIIERDRDIFFNDEETGNSCLWC